ncbi:hypothetical protein, partial [Treponema sp. R80B11-R83G3]
FRYSQFSQSHQFTEYSPKVGTSSFFGNNAPSFKSLFTRSIAAFKTWLEAQPDNDAATPYTVKLNISDLGGSSDISRSAGYVLRQNNNKYVSLDFSSSTFSSIESGAFLFCDSLTSVTIPDIRKTARFT